MLVLVLLASVMMMVGSLFVFKGRDMLSNEALITVLGSGYFILPLLFIMVLGLETDYYYTESSLLLVAIAVFWVFYFCFIFGSRFSRALVLGFSAATEKVGVVGIDKGVGLVCFLLVLLSFLSKLYLIKLGYFFLEDKYSDIYQVSIPGYIRFFNNIHLYSLSILTVNFVLYKKRVGGKGGFLYYLFWFVLLYSVAVAVAQGRRFGVVFPIMQLVIVYYYFFSIKVSSAIRFSVSLLVVFFVITVFRLGQAQALLENSDSSLEDVFLYILSNFSHILGDVFSSMVSRIGNPLIITSVVAGLREQHEWVSSFNTFELMISSLVPSFLWGDKPDVSIGNLFGREIGVISGLNYMTKINPSWVGEFYYNGFFSLLSGGVLMGMISGFYYNVFVKNRSVLGGVLLSQYFVFLFSGFQMEVAFSVNTLVKSSVLLVFIMLLPKWVGLILNKRVIL